MAIRRVRVMTMAKMEQWHRRHAIMLAGQLPENTQDALAVLEAYRELVERFIDPSDEYQASGENVFMLSRGRI